LIHSYFSFSSLGGPDVDALGRAPQASGGPTDISIVPDTFVAYPEEAVNQSEVLAEMIGNVSHNYSALDEFNNTRVNRLKLSALKSLYEKKDKNALNLLNKRHTVHIDEEFRLRVGTGQIHLNPDHSMIDYHLAVANRIGLSPLLPNLTSAHRFTFEMDLQKPYFGFRGKHATLGFDPAGRMLFIGRCSNEDVFFAMAPNAFLHGETAPVPAGRSSGPSTMSRRHYRQMVMMMAHFLGKLPEHPFLTEERFYEQDLNSNSPEFDKLTDVLYVPFISLHTSPLSLFETFLFTWPPPTLHLLVTLALPPPVPRMATLRPVGAGRAPFPLISSSTRLTFDISAGRKNI